MIPRRRRSAPALHPCVQNLCAWAAHAQGCAATPICELCATLKVAAGAVCGGVLDEADDGGGLLGRYETLYKKNKAKADEEMKAYKNSEAGKSASTEGRVVRKISASDVAVEPTAKLKSKAKAQTNRAIPPAMRNQARARTGGVCLLWRTT